MKRQICILLITAVLFTMVGCNQTTEANEVTMDVALGADIIRLDPAYAYDNETSAVINQITEPLLTHNQDNSLKNCLAESWEAVNPTTYVYKLRNDVKFSDGSPLTSEDVVFSLNRHLDPEVASYMNWMFSNVESIEATGDLEVTVKLKQPDATWKYVLATSAGMIVKKSYCEEKGEDFGSSTGGIIGTGPYVFDIWETGSKVILKKNPNYWDKTAKSNVDKIVFSIVADDTTLMTALKSGQIDFCATFSHTLIPSIRELDNVTLHSTSSMGVHYITFNTAKKPFDDLNVRKAISYAINLESIHNNIIKDVGQIGGQLPMTDSLFTLEREKWEKFAASLPPHEYNLDKAREYLAKSSVPNGFSCELLVKKTDAHRYDVALILQEMLKELNIEVKVIPVTGDEFFSYQFGNQMVDGIRNYDMMVATWGADYPDPAGNLDPLYTSRGIAKGGSNSASYSNPKVDDLLAKANASVDDGVRTDLLIEACKLIVDDTPYYVYNYPKIFVIINNKYEFGDMNLFSTWDWNFKNAVLLVSK